MLWRKDTYGSNKNLNSRSLKMAPMTVIRADERAQCALKLMESGETLRTHTTRQRVVELTGASPSQANAAVRRAKVALGGTPWHRQGRNNHRRRR